LAGAIAGQNLRKALHRNVEGTIIHPCEGWVGRRDRRAKPSQGFTRKMLMEQLFILAKAGLAGTIAG
jgi:hypothetical protein